MRTLTLRIYLTVVAVLLLFAFGSGWLFQRQIEQERQNSESVVSDRMSAWGDLIQRSLPSPDAPAADQAAALLEWSQRLRMPLALDSSQGARIVASDSFLRRQSETGSRGFAVPLDDGRTLWVMRPGLRQGMRGPPGQGAREAGGRGSQVLGVPFLPPAWQRGIGPLVVLVLLFIAVAAGAWPAVRHLTRRLQALKKGVEQFGAGQLHHRVEVSGRDEVAAVAASFNLAAERIETLVRSHQSLLANASHELRSPLARMKMAVSMLDDASPEQQQRLKREIDTNVAELDALVEEVLLASRLDAVQRVERREPVDLLALAAEEGARVDAQVDGSSATVQGDERLLRRALRNLLENARRYAGDDVTVLVATSGNQATVQVCDRGPGVPEAQRERIFEPFYRLPGHAEQAGGVGLGLSLVKQIAERHGGGVRCLAREGGGSCFELRFPAA
ncbi:MAG: HAMP domain-containing histidine kinase [Cytophagales bacterium]|nr:HAMP domain-containing histidine kinase [Rhizobacter sp.]